jgi:secernin
VDVITSLLEAHGQGGSCGHLSARFYDNSFIVADRDEVYRAGDDRAALGGGEGRADAGDLQHLHDPRRRASPRPDLEEFVRGQGWWTGNRFDFAAAVTNPDNPGLCRARWRGAGARRCGWGARRAACRRSG